MKLAYVVIPLDNFLVRAIVGLDSTPRPASPPVRSPNSAIGDTGGEEVGLGAEGDETGAVASVDGHALGMEPLRRDSAIMYRTRISHNIPY